MRIFSGIFVRLLFVMLFLRVTSALAAVPTTVSYQGYLTDTAGAAVDGNFSIEFSIYNVSAGGVALWNSTKAVSVSKGLLSVQLGDSVPFPVGLFDTPVFLGININNDGEMSPRRPFDTVAFAYKADDALTLDGSSAASLDQSAHVNDTGNPHNVTAGQTGAATVADIAAHSANAAAHHSKTTSFAEITGGQVSNTQIATGAVSGAEISQNAISGFHIIDNSVSAADIGPGAVGNSELVNGAVTDAKITGPIAAAKINTSGLDADLVDGLHANEIIVAASDEVRTPIDSLPFTISTPGSYYLVSNLTATTGGIDITADNVTLDLMGFTLFGNGVNDDGINLESRSNVTIKNGTVRDFGNKGIRQFDSTARNNRVFNVRALSNTETGILLFGHDGQVERSIASNNGAGGFQMNIGFTCVNCIATSNAGSGIAGATTITDSIANSNGSTGIQGSFGALITNNSVAFNGGTWGIRGLSQSVIVGNVVRFNTGTYGIYGSSDSRMADNTALNNSGHGIYGLDGSQITGNTVSGNAGSYGIYGGTGSTVSDNTANNNQHWGVYGLNSNLIERNTLYSNNLSNTVNEGGLRVGSDSRVIGNTLDSNRLNNIYVSGSDDAVESNHVADSNPGNGIYFLFGGSFYRNNTAAGNGTSFFNGANQSNGGGNVSF